MEAFLTHSLCLSTNLNASLTLAQLCMKSGGQLTIAPQTRNALSVVVMAKDCSLRQ